MVEILIAFWDNTRDFQSKEKELNMIRTRALSDDKSIYIPRESIAFSDLAPTQEMDEQGLFDAVKKCNS